MPLEIPDQKSKSISTAKSYLFGSVPVVHSISGYSLEKMGFIKFGIETKGQSIITTYKRGNDIVAYNGTDFIFNGKRVKFNEEITGEIKIDE